MNAVLKFTLLSDGPSDRSLIHPLTWLLDQQRIHRGFQFDWADFSQVRPRPSHLPVRIARAIELYPCDLLFVHRDAERESRTKRVDEIETALKKAQIVPPLVIYVIPVRMMEAWLLFDEAALRRAAGNPNGTDSLEIPDVSILESVPDPKNLLTDQLKVASGLSGRRLKKFRPSPERVAQYLRDYKPLRALDAFQKLEADLAKMVKTQGWDCK